jgi:hypothetical protein
VNSYRVKIGDGPNSALDDLKELSQPLRRALFHVMRVELRGLDSLDEWDDDEDAINSRWRWRRGITRRERRALAGVEYEATTAQQSCDFVIMYRDLTPTEVIEYEGQHGFHVERVISNAVLGSGIQRLVRHRDNDEVSTAL